MNDKKETIKTDKNISARFKINKQAAKLAHDDVDVDGNFVFIHFREGAKFERRMAREFDIFSDSTQGEIDRKNTSVGLKNKFNIKLSQALNENKVMSWSINSCKNGVKPIVKKNYIDALSFAVLTTVES